MNKKHQQFEKLINSLKSNIASDPFLSAEQKMKLAGYATEINADLQKGIYKLVTERLVLLRMDIYNMRKEMLFAKI